TGVPAHAARGRYVLTSVRTRRPTVLGLAFALLHGNRKVVDLDHLAPRRTDARSVHRQLAAEFEQSRVVAAAAAARAAGLPVVLTGTGARVTGLLSGVPGSGALAYGDVV